MPIPALIAAGGALVGTALTNSANQGLNEDQMWHNERMWRLNNEYNTPVNQMKRLRQAGINPHFAISGGSLGTGNSSTPPSPISPQPYDFSPLGEGIARSVELYQQKMLNDAEVDFKNAQAQNWTIKNINQFWKDYVDIQNAIKSGKLTDQEIEVAKAQSNQIWTNLQSLAEMNEVNIEKIRSEKDLNDARVRGEDARTQMQRIMNMFIPQQQKIITDNLSKEGQKILSEVNRNNREGALAAANEALTNAQRNGVNIDNRTKSAMAEYVVDEQFAKSEEARYKAGNEYKMYRYGRVGHELPSGGSDYPKGSTPVNGRK